jgi:hypothetical protein
MRYSNAVNDQTDLRLYRDTDQRPNGYLDLRASSRAMSVRE